MATKNNKPKKKTVKNKKNNLIFTFIMTVFLVIMFSVLYTQAQQKIELDKRIEAIEMEISKAEETTRKLQEQMEYQDSDEFVEEIAREKLNLVKPNEIVFVDKNK